MPVPIILPKFGFTLESCLIVQWLVKPGDTVREGDPLAEVETDKVNMEVEATADGEVLALLYNEGDDVPVTEVILYLKAPGEEIPTNWAPPGKAAISTPSAPAPAPTPPPAAPSQPVPEPDGDLLVTPVARRIAEENNISLSTIQGTGPRGKITRQDVEALIGQPAPGNGKSAVLTDGKVLASPAARRVAAEMGVDLATVKGTGPGGRVQGFDVEAAAKAAPAVAPAATLTAPAQAPATRAMPALADDEPQVVPLKGMRKTIATRLQQSYQQAPHIFFDASVDTRGINALRDKLKAQNHKLSVTSIIVKACAWTLKNHPWMNATFDGTNITLWNHAHIGVAVALENGLIVPVVRNADVLSLRQIQDEVSDLAARARDNSLMPDDMAGGTFTVSNLGMYGVDRFTAIINPPQVGILAVGRTIEQFVPDENGNPVLRPFMNITVSADHRVVDGAQVGQFITDLKAVLEEPMLLAW